MAGKCPANAVSSLRPFLHEKLAGALALLRAAIDIRQTGIGLAILSVGGILALVTTPASAADFPKPNRPIPNFSMAPAAGDHGDVGEAMPLAASDLATYRGGETLGGGNQTMQAVTTGNVLNGNYAAGAITLSDKALSSFSGVGNIAINTGAQVSLQSGMNLTVNIQQ